jgi:hypothetical protein
MALEIGAESASLGDHCIYSNIKRKSMRDDHRIWYYSQPSIFATSNKKGMI